MLEKEYNYYKKNKPFLLSQYNEKYIIIKGNKVLGAYDSESSALIETLKTYELGTFLLQYVSKGEDIVFSRIQPYKGDTA